MSRAPPRSDVRGTLKLPPDQPALATAQRPWGRLIVIGPTRALRETIGRATGRHLDAVMQRAHGPPLVESARFGAGSWIVAGTGAGKGFAVRPVSESILGVGTGAPDA